MKTLSGPVAALLASNHVPMAQVVRMFLPRTDTVQPGNSILYSANHNNAVWTKETGVSVTANSALCPDGSVGADLLTITVGTRGIVQRIVGTNNTAYSVSQSLKAGSVSSVRFGLCNQDETAVAYYTFDLTGSAGPTLQTLSGFSVASAVMTSEGNGWYTCSVSATSPASGVTSIGMFLRSVATGNLYLWASQQELATASSNYIPTQGTAVFGDTLAFSSSNRDIRYSGVIYRGANGLGTISQIDDSSGEIKGLSFQLSATSSTLISLALDGADLWQGAIVQIFTVLLEVTNYTVLDGMLEWAGIGDTFSIAEGANGSSISATAESYAVDLLRGSPSTINQSDQQAIDATDTAFQYVNDQVDKQILWPSREWFFQ